MQNSHEKVLRSLLVLAATSLGFGCGVEGTAPATPGTAQTANTGANSASPVASGMPPVASPTPSDARPSAPASNGSSAPANTPPAPAAAMPAPSANPPPAATTDMGAPPSPPVACDPADKTPDAEVIGNVGTGAPPTGPYKVIVEHDPGLATHTIYRPEELTDIKHPIVVWENGGCLRDGLWFFPEFLMELASHGSVILVDGEPNGMGMGVLEVDGAMMIAGLDWITAENDRPCSKYYRNIETSKVAAMGQSCGGLHAYGAAKDARVSTVVIWNSGLLERDRQDVYAWLHAPMAFFIGGSSDVAYPNAEADFAAITGEFPVFYGNLDVGHGATYSQDNGGEFARVGVGWLQWQLFNDDSANGKGMFVGADCGLCNGQWVIEKKNLE